MTYKGTLGVYFLLKKEIAEFHKDPVKINLLYYNLRLMERGELSYIPCVIEICETEEVIEDIRDDVFMIESFAFMNEPVDYNSESYLAFEKYEWIDTFLYAEEYEPSPEEVAKMKKDENYIFESDYPNSDSQDYLNLSVPSNQYDTAIRLWFDKNGYPFAGELSDEVLQELQAVFDKSYKAVYKDCVNPAQLEKMTENMAWYCSMSYFPPQYSATDLNADEYDLDKLDWDFDIRPIKAYAYDKKECRFYVVFTNSPNRTYCYFDVGRLWYEDFLRTMEKYEFLKQHLIPKHFCGKIEKAPTIAELPSSSYKGNKWDSNEWDDFALNYFTPKYPATQVDAKDFDLDVLDWRYGDAKIKAYSYDKKQRQLYVVFANSTYRTYCYFDVDKKLFKEFANTQDKYALLNEKIIPNFSCGRISKAPKVVG